MSERVDRFRITRPGMKVTDWLERYRRLSDARFTRLDNLRNARHPLEPTNARRRRK